MTSARILYCTDDGIRVVISNLAVSKFRPTCVTGQKYNKISLPKLWGLPHYRAPDFLNKTCVILLKS